MVLRVEKKSMQVSDYKELRIMLSGIATNRAMKGWEDGIFHNLTQTKQTG